ncbi:hypothetical protein YC2023_077934 [Brassica napus]
MAEYQFTISQGYSYSRTSFKMHAAFFLYLSKNLMSNVDSLAGSRNHGEAIKKEDHLGD